MPHHNKIFFIVFLVTGALTFGIMLENINTTLNPGSVKTPVDITQIKTNLTDAGIQWQDAQHWKTLP